MNKCRVFVAAFIAGVACLVSAAERKPLSPEKAAKVKERMEAMLKANGGFLQDRRAAVGKVAIIDAQKKVDSANFKEHIQKLESFLGLNVKYSAFAGVVDFSNLKTAVESAKGNVSVVLTESDVFPALVSMPEEKCVIVNVTALAKDSPAPEKLATRLRKEISRGVAFAFGCSYPMTTGNVMDPIFSLSDLDRPIVEMLGVPQRPTIDRVSEKVFGMKRYKLSNYRIACQEGWAPAPSNDYQRAIWKEVHELPSEPIKIEK